MKDDEIIRIAAIGFIAIVVAPVVIGATLKVIGGTAVGISNMINKVKFNAQIKKGLKDRSIIEVDGKYYEVENIEEA